MLKQVETGSQFGSHTVDSGCRELGMGETADIPHRSAEKEGKRCIDVNSAGKGV